MKKIKICIIGAGRAGEFHAKNLVRDEFLYKYELLYIIDKDFEKAKILANKINELKKINILSLSDKFLNYVLSEKKIDAIIICTTTSSHYELSMKCLRAKKHVFCEKPLGENENEIKNSFKLANELNLKLFIAYQKRFDKNFCNLYNLIKHNNLKIQNIRIINKDFPIPSDNYLKTSNGIVEDMICHDIDIINWYMNFEKPEKLVAFTYTHNKKLQELNEIEGIEIMMQYKNGEIITFFGSRVSAHGYDQRIEVNGDLGLLSLNNILDDNILRTNLNGIHTAPINYSFINRYKEAYIKELEHFYDVIINNHKVKIEEDHLILTKIICDSINKSILEKSIINL